MQGQILYKRKEEGVSYGRVFAKSLSALSIANVHTYLP
jgi:hypothetical protein